MITIGNNNKYVTKNAIIWIIVPIYDVFVRNSSVMLFAIISN